MSNSWNMDDSGEPSQHPHGKTIALIVLPISFTFTMLRTPEYCIKFQ